MTLTQTELISYVRALDDRLAIANYSDEKIVDKIRYGIHNLSAQCLCFSNEEIISVDQYVANLYNPDTNITKFTLTASKPEVIKYYETAVVYELEGIYYPANNANVELVTNTDKTVSVIALGSGTSTVWDALSVYNPGQTVFYSNVKYKNILTAPAGTLPTNTTYFSHDNTSQYYIRLRYFYYYDFVYSANTPPSITVEPEVFHFMKHAIQIVVWGGLKDYEKEQYHQKVLDEHFRTKVITGPENMNYPLKGGFI